MHKIADTFVLYFGDPTDESAVKDNFSTAYQLLEEMFDHGWPLTTEPNALTDLIKPPTMLAKIQQAISGGHPLYCQRHCPRARCQICHGVSAVYHTPIMKYIYIDIVEEIDAIL